MKRSVVVAVFACMCVLFGAGAALAAEFTMKVGHVVPESYPHHIAAVEYLKPYIERESGGRIAVELFPNSQLGGDRQLCEAVQIGSLEMAFPSTTILAGFVPELGLLDLPFLFATRDDVYKVVDINGPVGSVLARKAREQGIYLLGYADLGFMNLTNSARPITTPEDAKGIKIRVMENPVYIDTAMALGCSPITMAFGEVYTALQQGTIDGQENPLDTIRSNNIQEVQKFISMWNYSYDPILLSVSGQLWASLSDEDKAIFEEAGKAAMEQQRTITRERNVALEKEFADSGMEVYYNTDEEKDAFKAMLTDLIATYEKELGKELLTALGYYD